MKAYLSEPSARPEAKMNTDNDGRRSQRGLEEHFSEFIEGCFSYIEDNFELDQSFSAEFMPNKIDNDEVNTLLSPHIQNEQILPPGTPIVLSPASPISSPSSPNRGSTGWDSPQTPLPKSDQVDFDLSTPLTPIDTSRRTSKTCSFIDRGTQATPSDGTHESYQVFADSDTKVCRNLHSNFQAIRNTVVNESAAIADKNVIISPIKLESTSADANIDLENHDTEIQVKIEVSQATLGVDLTPKSLERSNLSKQSLTGANLSTTEIDDPVPPIATVTKKDGSDGFQGFQKNSITPQPVREQGTRKLFSGFQIDPEDNTATSLRLDKQNISFSFCTSAQVHFGSAVRDNRKVVTAKSHVRTGSVHLDPKTVVVSQSTKSINGLKKVLKHIIPFEVRNRLSDDEHRCVASYTKTPSRCVSKIYEPSSVLSARLASIVTCIKSHDYIALPDLVEKFLAVAVCDRHRNMALSQSIKEPRMDVLRELVVSFPNVPERNTATFKDWLQAIVGHELPSLVAETTCQPYLPTSSTGLSAILDQIMPAQVQDRVIEHPGRCVVSGCRLSHARDAGHCPQNQRIAIDRLTKDIAECAGSSISPDLPDHVQSLARIVMCCEHHKNAMSKSKIVKALISNLPFVPSHYLSVLGAWLRAVTNCELPMFPHIAIVPSLPVDGSSKGSVKPDDISAVVGSATPSYSPEFNPYQAKWSSNASITKDLRSKIIKPLSEADKKEGYVYIFWDQQHFGMVKIGRTDDLGQRLKQWSRQCKTTYHYHQSSRDGTLFKVPHIQRVERLIQIELVNCRKKRRCEGCGKTHIEWFDIDEAKAVQVYQKWRDWIMKRPYAEDHTGEWTIRPDVLDTLSKVCEPVILEKTKEKRPQLRRRSANDVLKQRKGRKST